jgi:hypothetical protein
MDEEIILSDVVKAVQGARLAFQSMCSNSGLVYGPYSRDLLALDVNLQALGDIVEILDGVHCSGAQIDFAHSILATPVISAFGQQISMAHTMIADMRNLERRLMDVQRDITTADVSNSHPPAQLLATGEAMNIRRMVEKYRSTICGASTGQIMCV